MPQPHTLPHPRGGLSWTVTMQRTAPVFYDDVAAGLARYAGSQRTRLDEAAWEQLCLSLLARLRHPRPAQTPACEALRLRLAALLPEGEAARAWSSLMALLVLTPRRARTPDWWQAVFMHTPAYRAALTLTPTTGDQHG